jgi:hypothetical protein
MLTRRAMIGSTAGLLATAPVAAAFPSQFGSFDRLTRSVVDPSRRNATDENNALGTFGRPRRTIPNPVPPGVTVEIAGTYTTVHTSPNNLIVNGTAERPVVIHGAIPSSPPVIEGAWELTGTHYRIEGLKFRGGCQLVAPNNRASILSCDFSGSATYNGALGLNSYIEDAFNENIVIHGCRSHDNGDVLATFDQDFHGLAIGQRARYVWILYSEFYMNSGDGIQINSASSRSTHHIALVGNVAHHNKQNGFWTKQCSDVVFLDNVSHHHRPSNSSLGVGMGAQYGPERVWFIRNLIHDCDFGIQIASDIGDGQDGQEGFFIDNVVRDLSDSDGGWSATNSWQDAGLSLQGLQTRHVLNMTMVNVPTGIAVGPQGTTYESGSTVARLMPGGVAVYGTLTPAPPGMRQRLRQLFELNYRPYLAPF